MLALQDLDKLQQRYGALSLAARARQVLEDAQPAIAQANEILDVVESTPDIEKIIEKIRNNPALMGKMRSSEAKNNLLDSSNDFIAATRNKIAAWEKTMERIADGEGIVNDKKREYISSNAPIAVAVVNLSATSAYFSLVQLILSETAQKQPGSAALHSANLAKLRRCATYLSDCEIASAFGSLIN